MRYLIFVILFLFNIHVVKSQFTPSTIPGLAHWYSADSTYHNTNNFVDTIYDLSNNHDHFVQINTSNQPQFIDSNLHDKAVIRFNGSNQFMESLFAQTLNQSYTIFTVWKTTGTQHRVLLDDRINVMLDNKSGSDVRIYAGNEVSYPKANPFDFIITEGVFDGINSQLFENGDLKSSGFVGNNDLPGLTMGKRIVYDDRYFIGDFSQLLIYEGVLTQSETDSIYSYLQNYYFGDVNLGADISKYGYCDTTLYAGERFESYLWSDGSTENSLVVTLPGQYWVETTDLFGFISRDTIEVLTDFQYPYTTMFCTNDSIIWNTNLGQHYSYLWSDGSTADTLIIDSPGDVHVVVTDSNGCVFESDTLTFSEDFFETTATLGADTSMCSGNNIEFISGANNAISYLWNTGETTPQLEVNSSGTYSIIAQNSNGCEAKDTIDVTITGIAPTVQMQIPSNACVKAPINFSDLSTTTDGSTIIGWTWAFGDGDSSTVATGNHAYSNSGMYDIDLIIETSSGCFNKLTQTIEVKENPMLTFATTNQCQFEGILFSGGQISPTTISSWDWNFADPSSGIENTANGQNTSHTFNDDGDFDVLLVGTDVFGCVDSLIQTINIVPAPTADFIFDEVCEGSIVNFQNTSTIVAPAVITGKLWDFGDGTASTQNNPQKPYSSHGIYDVELLVNSDNGCSNSITQTVKIHATPQVQHSVDQNCAGLETSFIDASFVPNGSVAQVSWRFDNQAPLNGFNITNNFSNSGIYELEHEVTSSFGCINANVSDVTINPFLNADFTFTPGAFITDYPIVFESTGSGANEYLWSFGNFATSQQADTSIVFEESQIGTTQIVQLKVENEWNCVDSMRIELPVLDQRTDLEISQLFSQEINGFLTIAVRLKNKGTTPITEVDLISQSPNTGSIKETWSGMLQSNEEEIYIFSASPSAQIPAEDTIQNYLCVNGEIIQPVQFIEEDLTNNEVCKTMTENQAVIINPYPNPVKDQLTIKLVMPKKGAVTLKVYNNLGKIIHVISDKQALEKGLTVFVLETRSWANGNYRRVYEGDGNVEAVEFVKI